MKCGCGEQADPDWGQCYECWLQDRPEEQEHEDQLMVEYKAHCDQEYAEHCRKEHEQYLAKLNAAEFKRKLPVIAIIFLLVLFLVAMALLLWIDIRETNACELPDYPPHRAATKALMGDYGTLKPWQELGYEKLLTVEPKPMLAWITNYWSGERGVNRTTASGRTVSSRVAAMIDKPWGTWVLISLPDGYELRQIFDTGSRRNLSRARSRGAQTWVDRWVPRRDRQSWVRPVYIF